MENIGFFSYSTSAAAFTLLSLLLASHWRERPIGPALFLACMLSATWALGIALGNLVEYPPVMLMQILEAARAFTWLFLLLILVSLQSSGSPWRLRGSSWALPYSALALTVLALISLRSIPSGRGLITRAAHYDLTVVIWLCLSIAGLLLIEQLYRNAVAGERWALKYFCFALAAMFGYDFFMYAEALLFRQLDAELWQARGLVSAVVSPWLAIAIARSKSWHVKLYISRQVVFHTVTLLGAGAYLLGMAAVGYFIRFWGGSWGGVFQLAFLAAAIALLVSIMLSGRLRALLRVLLSKHFYSQRYDYRQEWLNFTEALATLGEDVAEGIIRTMSPLATSPAGILFTSGDDSGPQLLAAWNMQAPPNCHGDLGNIPEWSKRTGWVIDLHEREQRPGLYEELKLPAWLEHQPTIWLIIPLIFRERVEGILMLRDSDVKKSLNWEDRDLLKTAGRQAATHLAQHLASSALVEARQFEAFNRLSAYVIHDLKNILAQQSLLIANAEKHRDNPAFVDDMVATVANSVTRMRRLMEQMRSGKRELPPERVALRELLREVIEAHQQYSPVPTADLGTCDCAAYADRERLTTVFSHLVKNAQEATPASGTLHTEMTCDESYVTVTVSDSGLGMSQDFIRHRLFSPFDSTKGLTGMGIGAFESREYIRAIGGEIEVESEPGQGTSFKVTIPSIPPEKIDAPSNRNDDFVAPTVDQQETQCGELLRE
jgi:putative PEP-CTERM system histidine kinase